MSEQINSDNDNEKLKDSVLRYFSFWPHFLVISVISLIFSYVISRYITTTYKSSTLIEIVDEAQDSEMALPTAMTIFNRSMINLENEISVLKSFRLNSKVVSVLKSNVVLYEVGKIKNTKKHRSEWLDEYQLFFNINTDTITDPFYFDITIENNSMEVLHFDSKNELVNTYKYNTLSAGYNNELPFRLKLNTTSYSTRVKKRIEFLYHLSNKLYLLNK